MGKFTLVVEGDSLEELGANVEAAAKGLGGGRETFTTTPITVVAEAAKEGAKRKGRPPRVAVKETSPPVEESAEEKAQEDAFQKALAKETGRKKAPPPVVDEDPFADPSSAQAAAAVTPQVEITFEEVDKAFRAVAGTHGIAKVREILAQFGQKAVKTLPKEDYPAALDACRVIA